MPTGPNLPPPGRAFRRAVALITAAEADLGRLSRGQRRDLLMDNTPWGSAFVRDVEQAVNDTFPAPRRD